MNMMVQPNDPPKSIALTWVDELEDRLMNFAEAFNRHEEASGCLKEYIDTGRALCAYESVEEVVNFWFQDKCDEISKDVDRGTYLEIKRTDLDKDVGDLQLSGVVKSGILFSEASVFELVELAVHTVDVLSFHHALMHASRHLLETGCKASANVLGREFGLVLHNASNSRDSIYTKSVGGRLVLSRTCYSSYSHERVRALEELKKHVVLFEAESGVTGLSDLFVLCIEEERSCSFDRVASRTRVAVEGVGCAIFFKEKMDFQIDREFFMTFFSFIMSFTDPDLHRPLTFD